MFCFVLNHVKEVEDNLRTPFIACENKLSSHDYFIVFIPIIT